MKLPAPVQAYFDADSAPEGAAPLDAFAPDAAVRDESELHVGHAAIEAWWRAAKIMVRSAAEPLEASVDCDRTTVRAKVTGDFPGSPVVLTFAFQLDGERISALEIVA